MSTTLTRTWKRRIAAHDAGQPIPKSHVYAFRKLTSRSSGDLPADLFDELCKLHARGFAWAITPEQTEQGLAWLKLRKVQKEMRPKQKAILDDFSHFLFVGFEEIPRGYGFSDYLPIYRVCSHAGPWFDYISRPWVAGHLFEVL